MKVTPTSIPDVLMLEPKIFGDARGLFLESFNERTFAEAAGTPAHFVQDNHSRSSRGVLRGLHYQIEQAQGKLVWVVRGSVFDVAVDMRKSSPTFGRWVSAILSEDNFSQLWIPPGFAHGFQVISESADLIYKTTDYYAPRFEQCLAWDDPQLNIDWPIASPVLSAKDLQGAGLTQARAYP